MIKNIFFPLFCFFLGLFFIPTPCNAQQATSFRSATELARDMFPGWNLGNTLEATGGEVSWQNTMTSQEIIDYIKSLGFRSVRIPCAWNIYMKEDGRIDAKWMARVKEVVDYCIKDSLYVVLNDHWDNGWIEVEGFSRSAAEFVPVTEDIVDAKAELLKKIWTQIAKEFVDYDEHLIFAGMNEPFQEYSVFHQHHAELTPILLRYNQTFVNAVRATGGNNLYRSLVVQGPSVVIDSTVELFSMPNDYDNLTNRLFVETHFYDPWDFTGGVDAYYWGGDLSWMSENARYAKYASDEVYISGQFSKLYNKFVKNDIPVILGEYSANWRDISEEEGEHQEYHDASVKAYYYAVNKYAIDNGLVAFVWDINYPNQDGLTGTSTIVDREKICLFNKIAYDGLKKGVAEGIWPY